MLGMTISSVASSLFEELYNNQKLWSKWKYMVKKKYVTDCILYDNGRLFVYEIIIIECRKAIYYFTSWKNIIFNIVWWG